MTTWGGFGLIVCAFIIPPIVLLHRSAIPSLRVWIVAIPVVTVSTYLGIFLGPVIFTGMCGRFEWPCAASHRVMLTGSFVFSLWIAVILSVAKRRSEREETKRKQNIQKAIEKITADGVVEGPKGPYVPHEQWGSGTEPGTPHETKGKDGHGPYGIPMP
jgi:hypothetical protein